MKLDAYLEIRSAVTLAETLNITPVLISHWKTGVRGIPIKRCLDIERATGKMVTRKDLRSDWMHIWPELLDK